MPHQDSTANPEAAMQLVAAIYDCVLDPDRWDDVLDRIRHSVGGQNCVITVADMRAGTMLFDRVIGIDSPWRERMGAYSGDVLAMFRTVADMNTRPLDRPFTMLRDVAPEVVAANRYVREWGRPQGIGDALQLFLTRAPDTHAGLAIGRRARRGPFGNEEIATISHLAPHLRRALAVSAVIESRSALAVALAESIEQLSSGMILVDSDASVIHCNEAARGLLCEAGALHAPRGRLAARRPEDTARLRAEIACASGRSAGPDGPAAAALGLSDSEGYAVTVHIVPLSETARRAVSVRGPAAAVFVAAAGSANGPPLDAVAEAFGFTAAETRVLARLMAGGSLSAAAQALGIAPSTARTHLSRLLAKTGAARQPELIALVGRLCPPLHGPQPD